MSEIVQAKHRGKALGFVQSSWAVGSGAAALIYALTFYLLPEDTRLARRCSFVAIIPALFVFYIRKYVDEPEVFERHARSSAQKASLCSTSSRDESSTSRSSPRSSRPVCRAASTPSPHGSRPT